jgi:hypothetical protein
MKEHTQQSDDLAWQAFCYVAGELSGVDLANFETLLAENQAAREAVASAVELSQATVLALGSQPPTLARRRFTVARWAWLATGVAACVVAALGIVQFSQQPSPTASGKADALAARWSEVRQEQASQYPWEESIDVAAASDWALSLAELEDRDAPAIATPDWMLAAVLEQKASRDMSGEIERGGESQEQ